MSKHLTKYLSKSSLELEGPLTVVSPSSRRNINKKNHCLEPGAVIKKTTGQDGVTYTKAPGQQT